jgi:hypothetical protein
MYKYADIFINKYFNVWLLVILYNALMHKWRFGQAYCQDLLTRIPIEFILKFIPFSMHFRFVLDFLEILKGNQKSKNGAQYWARLRPRGRCGLVRPASRKAAWHRLGRPMTKGRGGLPASGTQCARCARRMRSPRPARPRWRGVRQLDGGRMGAISSRWEWR